MDILHQNFSASPRRDDIELDTEPEDSFIVEQIDSISEKLAPANKQAESEGINDCDRFLGCSLLNSTGNLAIDELVEQMTTPTDVLRFCKVVMSALFSNDLDTLEELLPHIPQIMETIDKLIDSQFFRTKEKKVSFLRYMHRWTKAVLNHHQEWEDLQSELEESELEGVKNAFLVLSADGTCLKTRNWGGFGSNKAEKYTKHVVDQAEKSGKDIEVRVHRLPSGCTTIAELWRKDVNDVVASILHVSISPWTQ